VRRGRRPRTAAKKPSQPSASYRCKPASRWAPCN
jgi:hypothetical protein